MVGVLMLAGAGAARADEPGTVEARVAELFQRRAGRLVVESGQMVSDGRTLQRQGDRSLRRADEAAWQAAGAPEAAAQPDAQSLGDGSGNAGRANR
jgi:hypothetical protein